ncbi:hypothetical protein OPQ81_002608 [Rhizoctonia solani]|nr:hypothetical protein OPQ81_002608 [Rhizoctonia solani]
MQKSNKKHPIQSMTALLKWEDDDLDTLSSAQNADAKYVASRIDLSLGAFHTKLSEELAQSRVALARVRNKISSQIYSLPNEVLGEVFKQVVYTPGQDEDIFPSMDESLTRIFKRLHGLLAVCSTWRTICMGLGDLWSVIPVGDGNSSFPTPEVTALALQRSQALISSSHPLQLAVVLSDPDAQAPSFVKGEVPQFTSTNIDAQFTSSTPEISSLLQDLLASQSPSVMAELAINQYFDPEDHSFKPPQEDEYLDLDTLDQNSTPFMNFIGSMSSLWMRGTHIHWNTITFSDKLVHLHLQSVVLGDHSKLDSLLRAIGSASQLRDVKLISIIAFTKEGSDWDLNVPTEEITLPNLQTLLLDDLTFNVLNHILSSISPGSHQLKVGLGTYSRCIHRGGRDFHSDFSLGDVADTLRRSNVDTLFINGSRHAWSHATVEFDELRSMLWRLDELNTLIIASWEWNPKEILGLKRPENRGFADLAELFILDSNIPDPELLPEVVASYSLETLVLNCVLGDNADQVVRQLNEAVPDFRLVKGISKMDDFKYDEWRLW